MDSTGKRLVAIPDARHNLGGIGHTTIYDLINRGELTKVNIGRRSFITAESIAAYVDRLNDANTMRHTDDPRGAA
ncbi:helix-turn-helix domain-containing protein [Candidatus Mycolicibacterium alkanivorans]|uniref:Helix-turn-helix domain-containing protein n=1 Tax=Candidatus Mycolicibacterium alkanivorans TaxID=2954114 RepID=A0ABS9YU86_9MYCO|nr:helix-turn-helix domain-containing protein [Candidatus Mycolicibacterium alkanivorans]MCI4674787.1 helix-turn-helix domain-containing protein [Candidatus Mycolicibacterium alkanivorans]